MTAPAPDSRWPHTGVILAGGHSRRMGRAKATLPLAAGGTLIEAVHEIMAEVCAKLVISGTTDALPSLARVTDERAGAGPLAGIEAVLASNHDEEYLFCPCDMPVIDPATLRRLLAPTARGASVLHVEGETHPRPLPARFAAAALPVVRATLDEGRRAVHQALDRLVVEIIPVPSAVAGSLVNVNTPDEYRDVSQRIHRGGPRRAADPDPES